MGVEQNNYDGEGEKVLGFLRENRSVNNLTLSLGFLPFLFLDSSKRFRNTLFLTTFFYWLKFI